MSTEPRSSISPGPVPAWSRRPMAEERFFLGDDDRGVKELQQRTYPDNAWHLFRYAFERFEAACRLAGTEPDLLREAREVESVERPVLEQAYSRIAAWYRYVSDSGRQLRLSLSRDDSSGEWPDYAWWEFYVREVKRLVAKSDAVVRLVLFAVVARGSDEGRVAEARLADIVASSYGGLTVSRRLEYRRVALGRAELAFWRSVEKRQGFARERLFVPGRRGGGH